MEQHDKGPYSGQSLDVSNQMSDFLKNKFGKDTRYKEVEHMLSSSQTMNLKIDSVLGSN